MGFNTALSGIKASADALSVTGNNIANSDTTGFKQSRIEFGDLYSTNVVGAGSNNTIGAGVNVNNIAQAFSAGNISYTSNNLDIAVDGTGFFVVNLSDTQTYTRAGDFKLDAEGNLVTNDGGFVQGYNAVEGIVGGNLENLRVPTDRIPPQATEEMSLQINIDSESKDVPPFIDKDFDPNNPETYDFTQTHTVTDANGNNHIVTYYYAKSDVPNTYQMHASVDGSAVNDAGDPWLVDQYATFNDAAGGSDYNLDGIPEEPYELLYMGSGKPDLQGVITRQLTDIAIAGNINGIAIADTLIAADVVEPISVARDPFDPTDPGTYTYGNTKTIYDALGEEHTLGYYFIKHGENNTYEMLVTIDGKQTYPDPVTGEEKSFIPDNTAVTFDNAGNINGTFQGFPPYAISQPIVLEITGFDPTNRSSTIPIDMEGSTQYALSSTDSFAQDGYTAGELQGVSFNEEGYLVAIYTNQQTAVLGQIALSTFDNTDGLTPAGDTAWVASTQSGQANIGKPKTGTLGGVMGGALEESNVDLTSELVALIEAQRNYQANSKTLETENTVTQTILNLR
ncbi:flagellar hook-basal body complex protein [Marinomonas agarivorans]|nr:flagellar hook-basal body complex protein [Marinomonas agarivorans]